MVDLSNVYDLHHILLLDDNKDVTLETHINAWICIGCAGIFFECMRYEADCSSADIGITAVTTPTFDIDVNITACLHQTSCVKDPLIVCAESSGPFMLGLQSTCSLGQGAYALTARKVEFYSTQIG